MEIAVVELYELLKHLQRVADLSFKVASHLGICEYGCIQIYIAGFLHDIGKQLLDPNILYKEGKLTLTEFEHIKLHPIYSVEIIQNFNGVNEFISQSILNHHENMDGTGYFNIENDDINIGAKIIKVCDVYDALTSNRIYRKAYTPKQALNKIKSSMDHYDQSVFKALECVLQSNNYQISKDERVG